MDDTLLPLVEPGPHRAIPTDPIDPMNAGRENGLRTTRFDRDLQARQEAGLAVLAELAAQMSFAMSEAAATTALPPIRPRLLEPEKLAPSPPPAAQSDARHPEVGAPPAGRLAGLRTDHLVRNSLFLILSSGIQAALGFTFWIVMARLFSTADVGRASSLISATALIAYFSLFGLNSTLMRFLPTAEGKGRIISAAFLLVAGAGATIGLIYILLTPVFAPRLAFVAHNPAMIFGFVMLAGSAAVNLLTDSVFIASRKASLCAMTDGAVGGLSKILLGVFLTGTGAYGLFVASAGGFAAAALASIVLMIVVLHWRPSLTRPLRTLKHLLGFSAANYVANVLNLLPSMVVPLIVLDRLGARPAAYYFVSFQMATLLYAAIYAVESSFLAEGSQAQANWRKIRRRSIRLAITLFVPGGVVLALAARWVLLAFGPAYSQNGATSLELLAGAVIPIAACSWSWTVLRISERLTLLVISNALYAGSICGLAWVLAGHGLTATTAAWPIGASLSAIVATLASIMASRRRTARHRKTTRSRLAAADPAERVNVGGPSAHGGGYNRPGPRRPVTAPLEIRDAGQGPRSRSHRS